MGRVTSKLQVTVPKVIAEQFSIRPGDDIDWVPAGDGIRVIKRTPPKRAAARASVSLRLRLFDETTKRVKTRPAVDKAPSDSDRGWTREGLYDRDSIG